MSRARASTLCLFALTALFGCGNPTKKLEGQVAAFKTEMDPQIQLMTRHSKFLKKKAETIAAKVDKLEAEQAQINGTLGALASAPGAAKHDILVYVDAKADTMAQFQRASLREFSRFLDERDAKVQQTLKVHEDSLRTALGRADTFVRFVMTNQDTTNQEFAQRFEQKPWYTSILGRWEQKKASKH